jgi:uncharacterized BrkB/YihY/UPF0761 family membrane protein
MGFLIFWLVSTVITFLTVRLVVVHAFKKNEEKAFGDDKFVFYILLIGSFVPFLNLLLFILVVGVIIVEIAGQLDVDKLAKKVFFIRGEKSSEKAKKAPEEFSKRV